MSSGTPIEYFAFTYGGAETLHSGNLQAMDDMQRAFLETYAGNPAHYGAPATHSDLKKA